MTSSADVYGIIPKKSGGAERGSYHPMHVGDDWRKWGTVKCIHTKRNRRVYALGGPGCDKYKPAKEVRP